MRPVEIEVVVGEDGEVALHVIGARGKACTDLTVEVEKALGRVIRRTATREAHEVPLEARRCIRH